MPKPPKWLEKGQYGGDKSVMYPFLQERQVLILFLKNAVVARSSNLWWVAGVIMSCQCPCTREASVSIRNAGSSKKWVLHINVMQIRHLMDLPLYTLLPSHVLCPKEDKVWKHMRGSTLQYYSAIKLNCYVIMLYFLRASLWHEFFQRHWPNFLIKWRGIFNSECSLVQGGMYFSAFVFSPNQYYTTANNL